jgi:hypothetical protein
MYRNKEHTVDKLAKLEARYLKQISKGSITAARKTRDEIVKLRWELGLPA